MSGGKRSTYYGKRRVRIAFGAILLAGLVLARPVMCQGNPPVFNNAPTIALPTTCVPGVSPYALGDVTNSGNQSLVIVCLSNIVTVLGNGDGTFQTATPKTTAINGTNPNGIQLVGFQISLADMNGDGKLDLVTADGDCNVNVFLGNGDGTFQHVPNQTPEGTGTPGVFCGFAAEPFLVTDLNHDSKPDIVLENNFGTNKSLSVLLNTTNTTNCSSGLVCFSQTNVLVVSSSSQKVTGLTAGNFTPHSGSDTPDIVVGISTPGSVGSGTANSVLVLQNNGSGLFTPLSTVFSLPQTPKTNALSGFVAADFNGDGNPDVAAEDPGDGAIFILYGDGHGNLSSCSQPGTPASIASCQQTGVGQTISGLPLYLFLATGNFSGPSGPPGLLFANTNNGFSVLLGGAKGFLQTVATNYIGAGINPATPNLGDLNGDGFTDAIVPAGNQLSVLLNNQTGILEDTQAFPAGTAPSGISLLQNFFGNNEQDVAVAQSAGNTVTVLGAPATGPNGTLPQSSGPVVVTGTATEHVTAMTSGCLDNSSPCVTPFVAFATYDSTTNNATTSVITSVAGHPTTANIISSSLSSQPITAMAAGDFNGDGITDLAFAFGNSILVFTGNGNGTFSTTPQTFSFGFAGANPVALAVANFGAGAAGFKDIAVLDESSGSVWILLNNGSNPFSFQSAAPYQSGISSPTGMTVGDFNNDGKPDIAVTTVLSPSGIIILLNNGSGVFALSSTLAIPVANLIGPIATGDFNGDGNLDLVVAIGFDLDTVQILTGDGTGINFAATTPPTPAGLGPNSLAVADFNGDGKPDIAVTDGASNAGSGNMVALLLNESSTPPFAEYSNIGPINFGPVQVNATGTQSLNLKNTGSSAFMVNGISLQGSSSAFSITNAVCNGNAVGLPFTSPINLGAGGTCTFTLQFLPTLNQNGYGELLVVATTTTNSNASAGPGGTGQAFLLIGDGVEPFASFTNTSTGSPTQVTFGNVTVNIPATQIVTVTNTTGTGPLTIQSASLTGAASGFSYTTVVCNGVAEPSPPTFPIILNPGSPGGSCTFTVQFDPLTVGPLSGSLGFLDNAGGGESNLPSAANGSSFTQTIPLLGTGVGAPPPPPAVVTDNETITVTDTPSFPDVFDTEPITVTDSVNVAACGLIRITPSNAPSATVGTPYAQLFTTAEVGTFLWATSGSVPPGLTMNSSTGVLSGTPTSTGSANPVTFNFTVTATDPNGCPGSASVSLTVNPAAAGSTATIIPLVTSSFDGIPLPATFALVGNPVTVNFKVQPTSGSANATGTVMVSDGFSPADTCSGPLAAGAGSCQLTISQLGSGNTPLTATYKPDASSSGLLASTSSSFTENIVQIASCGIPPSAQTSAQGTTVTYTLSVCLAGDVQALSAAVKTTGCPQGAQCSATINPIQGQPGVYSVVVTIVIGGNIFLQNSQPRGEAWRLPLFGFIVLLAMVTTLQFARQKRARPRPRLLYAVGILIAAELGGMSGCSNVSITPPNTYTVSVTVTAGNFSVTVPLTLTVTR